jgi:hypothetical protein
MIDKKLEGNIRKTKEFIEIWDKFRRIFGIAVSENRVNENKEKEILSIRDLLDSRYEDLMDSLEVKPLERFVMCQPIYNLLSLEKLLIMSDEKLKTFEKDWAESYRFLAGLLGKLEKKKRRISGFNALAFRMKKRIRGLK